MKVEIKKLEVATGDDADAFVHRVTRDIRDTYMACLWWACLSICISDAAIEEMRVRAAYLRVYERMTGFAHCNGCDAPGCDGIPH